MKFFSHILWTIAATWIFFFLGHYLNILFSGWAIIPYVFTGIGIWILGMVLTDGWFKKGGNRR